MKWEYKIFNIVNANEIINPDTDIGFSNASFNAMGDDGWELVAVSQTIAYFKRIKS